VRLTIGGSRFPKNKRKKKPERFEKVVGRTGSKHGRSCPFGGRCFDSKRKKVRRKNPEGESHTGISGKAVALRKTTSLKKLRREGKKEYSKKQGEKKKKKNLVFEAGIAEEETQKRRPWKASRHPPEGRR